MKKLTDLGASPRTGLGWFWGALSWFVLAFLAFGFYSYKPGKASLLNELTGSVLLLGWVFILLSVWRTPRQPSSPAGSTGEDVRENPWKTTKTFAILIAWALVCCGAIYAGVIAFWSDKVLYWPSGRGRPPLYLLWADSSVLAFATALTWLLLGLMMGWCIAEFFRESWKI